MTMFPTQSDYDYWRSRNIPGMFRNLKPLQNINLKTALHRAINSHTDAKLPRADSPQAAMGNLLGWCRSSFNIRDYGSVTGYFQHMAQDAAGTHYRVTAKRLLRRRVGKP